MTEKAIRQNGAVAVRVEIRGRQRRKANTVIGVVPYAEKKEREDAIKRLRIRARGIQPLCERCRKDCKVRGVSGQGGSSFECLVFEEPE